MTGSEMQLSRPSALVQTLENKVFPSLFRSFLNMLPLVFLSCRETISDGESRPSVQQRFPENPPKVYLLIFSFQMCRTLFPTAIDVK